MPSQTTDYESLIADATEAFSASYARHMTTFSPTGANPVPTLAPEQDTFELNAEYFAESAIGRNPVPDTDSFSQAVSRAQEAILAAGSWLTHPPTPVAPVSGTHLDETKLRAAYQQFYDHVTNNAINEAWRNSHTVEEANTLYKGVNPFKFMENFAMNYKELKGYMNNPIMTKKYIATICVRLSSMLLRVALSTGEIQ